MNGRRIKTNKLEGQDCGFFRVDVHLLGTQLRVLDKIVHRYDAKKQLRLSKDDVSHLDGLTNLISEVKASLTKWRGANLIPNSLEVKCDERCA